MHGLRYTDFHGGHARIVCAAAGLLVLVVAANAQAPAVPPAQPDVGAPPAQAAPPTQAEPGRNGGGFIDAFGHFIESSVGNWNSGIKGAADAANSGIKGATDAAKDAADTAGSVTRDTAGAVARIPSARVISERATCPTAPNGAPDCRTAAEAICKAHGFASGSSVDFQTAEKCPPVALNRPNGEPPPPCVIESYVTRALCQ